jgi:hypothetical protein
MIKKNYKLFCVGFGILAILALYFTWCVSTITYKGGIYNIIHFICTALTAFLYIICNVIFIKYWNEKKLRSQIQVLNIALLMFFILLTIYDILENSSVLTVASNLIWVTTTVIVYYLMPINAKIALKKLQDNLKANCLIVFLLIISTILTVYPTMLQFKWDGALYEQACRNMNIHSMSSIAAYAHISHGYGVLFCVADMVIGDTQMAMAMVNVFMYLCSICAFNGIIRHTVPNRKRITYLLATAVYAFSPYTLGMVNYYSLDYATLCLFVCMLYFTLKEQWILQFVAALFTCFTKEPAIVSYGGFCVGIVVVDFIQNDNKNSIDKIRDIITKPQYYLMLVTGILWIITYMFLGGWSAGEGYVALDGSYIVQKNLVLYVLNFSWLFILVCIIGYRSVFKNVKLELPMFVSTFCFTIFSIVFKTSNHARYTAQIPAVLYVIGVVVVLYMFKDVISDIILTVMALLLITSSYMTIDPVSKICFRAVDVGNMEMISTGTLIPGDSMIYNKQMLGFEYAINQAVGDALENDCMVIMPTYNNVPNLFDGLMQYMETQDYGYMADTYWLEDANMRTKYEDGDTREFTIYELNSDADILQLPLEESEKHCFIYSELLGEDRALEIQELYPDAEYREYNAKGWTVSMLVF